MKILLYTLIAFILFSCDYSTDIDTPRKIDRKENNKIIKFSEVEFVTFQNSSEYKFITNVGNFIMDTSGSVPVLWSDSSNFTLRPEYESDEIIHEFFLRLDSLHLKQDSIYANYNFDEGVESKMSVWLGSPGDPFLIEPDGFNRLVLYIEEFVPGDKIVLYIKFKIYPLGRDATREGYLTFKY